MVKGEPDDIDHLAEAIRFLDQPVPQVRIDCRVEDTPAHIIRSWGLDFRTFSPELDVASQGNAPGSGPLIKWALAGAQGLLGRTEQVSRSVTMSGLSIVTSSGLAAEAGFGQVLPFFTSTVTYDALGNRHVDYSVDTIFTGLQLWVLPNVLPNDLVRMTVRPVFSFAAGTVQGPNGEQIPVERYETVATTVTVPDGEPMVIGGMGNLRDEANKRFGGMLQGQQVMDNANPLLIVTPHILHEPGPE
jgi:type II secretory pathway component GspD/PulD (secretin)